MVKVCKRSPTVTTCAKRDTNGGSECGTPSEKTSVLRTRKKSSRNLKEAQKGQLPSIASTGRSSIYRGVTRHRWTGRFEAHLWDKSCWNDKQNKKGKQVYLGAYDDEEAAARAYDLAALKYWGPGTLLNFKISEYEKEINEMRNMSREEYLATLRRRSSGFSRGVSKYRGVARHHHNGRWEARIGRVLGNKYLYLGTYSTQEEAAAAYDVAAIQYRGSAAVTNFELSHYTEMQRLGELETSSCMGNNLTAFPEQESNSMPYPNMSISSAGYVSVCSPVSEESVASYQVASNLSSEPTSILNYTPLDSWPLVPTYISRRLGQLPSYALQSTQQSCCANPVAEAIFSEADVSKAAVTVGIPEAQSVITKQFLDEQTAENEVTNTSITAEKGEAISATSMLESCNGLLANHDYQHGSEIWMPDDFASFDTNPCVLPDFDPADVWVGMEMEHEDVFLESIIPKSYPSLYPFPIRACS